MNTKSKKDIKVIGRGTSLAGLGIFSQKALSILVLYLQTQYLGIEKYGAFSVALGIIMLLLVIQQLGFTNGMKKFCVEAKVDKNKNRLWGIFIISIIVPFSFGVLLSILVFGGVSIYFKAYDSPVFLSDSLKTFCFILPLLGISLIPGNLTTAFETNRYYVLSKDVLGLLIEVSLLLLIFVLPSSFVIKGSITFVILIRALREFVVFIYSTYGFYKLSKIHSLSVNIFSLKTFKETFQEIIYCKKAVFYCLPLMMGGAFQKTVQWTDTVFVGLFLDMASAGAYRIAVQLATLLTSILSAMGSIFGPVIAKYYYSDKDTGRLKELYLSATRWTVLIASPFIVVLAIFPGNFLGAINQEATFASYALIILVMAQGFNLFTGNVGVVLIMAGKPHFHAINGLVVSLTHVIFCYLLIPSFGLLGAASSSVISVVLLNSLRTIETNIFFGIHCFSRKIIFALLPALLVMVVLLVFEKNINQLIHNNVVFVVIVSLFTCVAVWSAFYFFMANSEDKEFFLSLIKLRRSPDIAKI